MMLDAFRPGESILWDTIWQSTIFLGTGLGASVLYTRRPARAHRLLVLAMLAALAAPILAQGPRLGGWGLFGQSAESPPTRIAAVSKTPSATVDLPLITGESLPLPWRWIRQMLQRTTRLGLFDRAGPLLRVPRFVPVS